MELPPVELQKCLKALFKDGFQDLVPLHLRKKANAILRDGLKFLMWAKIIRFIHLMQVDDSPYSVFLSMKRLGLGTSNETYVDLVKLCYLRYVTLYHMYNELVSHIFTRFRLRMTLVSRKVWNK